jgi:hypothetical protein
VTGVFRECREETLYDLAGTAEKVFAGKEIDTKRTINPTNARYKGMLNPIYPKARISVADDSDRDSIYALRHEVYAEELNQHKTTHDRMLRDTLDTFNTYIVAKIDGQLVGFVSITPPGFGEYSIDKYLARENVDLSFDEGLYEMRILTVARPHRGTRCCFSRNVA